MGLRTLLIFIRKDEIKTFQHKYTVTDVSDIYTCG